MKSDTAVRFGECRDDRCRGNCRFSQRGSIQYLGDHSCRPRLRAANSGRLRPGRESFSPANQKALRTPPSFPAVAPTIVEPVEAVWWRHFCQGGMFMKPQTIPADAQLKWMPTGQCSQWVRRAPPDWRSDKERRNRYRADEVPGKLPSPCSHASLHGDHHGDQRLRWFWRDKIDKAT